MATNSEIESFFEELEISYDTVGEGIWVLNLEEQGIENLVINHEPPLILFRIKLMDMPSKNREEFFKRLLELNATDLVHGAYGLEEGNIILIDSLQSENLDINELEASIESLAFAATQHYAELSKFR